LAYDRATTQIVWTGCRKERSISNSILVRGRGRRDDLHQLVLELDRARPDPVALPGDDGLVTSASVRQPACLSAGSAGSPGAVSAVAACRLARCRIDRCVSCTGFRGRHWAGGGAAAVVHGHWFAAAQPPSSTRRRRRRRSQRRARAGGVCGSSELAPRFHHASRVGNVAVTLALALSEVCLGHGLVAHPPRR